MFKKVPTTSGLHQKKKWVAMLRLFECISVHIIQGNGRCIKFLILLPSCPVSRKPFDFMESRASFYFYRPPFARNMDRSRVSDRYFRSNYIMHVRVARLL